MTQEALKLALEFIENSECGTADLEARIKEALAQRTWKNLTKTQINAIFCRNALKADGGQSFARAIEAKLKELNT